MLRTRILTAIILFVALCGALFFLPTVAWFVLVSVICALAAWEWGGLSDWHERTRIAYAVTLGAFCLALLINPFKLTAHVSARDVILLLGALFWFLVVPLWLGFRWSLRSNLVASLTGVLVLVPSTIVFALLRELVNTHFNGGWVVIIVAGIAWSADIAAYFSGRAFGRRKLAPSISPGKTWAGAVCAVLGVLVYGNTILLCGGFFATAAGLTFILFQVMLVLLTAFSIVGDLFESLLKRQAGVKDSSALLPGHGGILDRVDSLTAMLPVLWLLYVVFVYLQ